MLTTPSPEDLAVQYSQMSEPELIELVRSYDGLLEIAQEALRAEFARRGLEPPLVDEPEEKEFRRKPGSQMKTLEKLPRIASVVALVIAELNKSYFLVDLAAKSVRPCNLLLKESLSQEIV
jgi:hypothetical protein